MGWRIKSSDKPKATEYRKPEYAKLYADVRWKRASRDYRDCHPLCAECERNGVIKAAECVDHIKPHRGDAELFWDRENWQSLCDSCHAVKTRGEG